MFLSSDERYMSLALSLARRGLGMTAPNPTVGCVIVQNGMVTGRGNTAMGGRPHAETIALQQAGASAKGATAYITLEPCSHHGKTPPCAEALIAADIARAVIATKDSNPQVSGRGIQLLQQAGIAITLGVGEEEARHINEGFFKVHEHSRPMVTLKLATTLDGKIATHNGESQWITGIEARQYAHLLRAQHDAIMVGINTVKADDPHLTCRLPGLFAHNPIRVVIDSQLDIRPNMKLITSAQEVPTWIITTKQHSHGALPETIKVYPVDADTVGRVDIKAALNLLAAQGITRVLVEGGAKLAASLFKKNHVDRLVWFHAPKVIGNSGISAIGDLERVTLAKIPHFRRESVRALGEDIVEVYRKG